MARKKKRYDFGLKKLKITKPALKPGESEDDWMKRCVPILTGEGKEPEAAVAQCLSRYRQAKGLKKDDSEFDKDSKYNFEINTYPAPEDFELDGIKIEKGQELRFVLGCVLEPETVDATTTESTIGDIYSTEEVRKAAHDFMVNYRGSGNDFMHSGKDSSKLKIVESYIAPADMTVGEGNIKKGTWMMGTLVFDDGIWQAVKKGEITGYSVGGVASGKIETAV